MAKKKVKKQMPDWHPAYRRWASRSPRNWALGDFAFRAGFEAGVRAERKGKAPR